MIHQTPNRASSREDSVNAVAQRLGRAMMAADMFAPDKYQSLQARALLAAALTPGGLDSNERLTDKGMLAAALVLERAVNPRPRW